MRYGLSNRLDIKCKVVNVEEFVKNLSSVSDHTTTYEDVRLHLLYIYYSRDQHLYTYEKVSLVICGPPVPLDIVADGAN